MAQLAPILEAAVPYITAGASALSGISAMQSANYQAAVASNNAKLLEEQASRETFAANQDIADQDAAARAQIAGLQAEMDASGINAGTGSMLFRRTGLESVALRDRDRLQLKRDNELKNTKQQAAGQRSEAKAQKRAGRMSLLSTLLDIPTSFLSGASMVNDYKRNRMSLSSPSSARS